MLVTINLYLDFRKCKTRQQWQLSKLGEEDWNIWRTRLPELPPVPSYESLTAGFNIAAQECLKKTKEYIGPKYSKPWWTPECSDRVNQRNRAKNSLKRSPSPANLIEYKRCEALFRRETKKAKRISKYNFSTSINKDTPIKEVWKKIRAFSNKNISNSTVPIIYGDSIFTEPREKAECIAEGYAEVLNSPAGDHNPVILEAKVHEYLNDTTV